MKFNILALLTLAVGLVSAQSFNDVLPCAKPCVLEESRRTSCPLTNPKDCLCKKADKFRILGCLNKNCSKEDKKKSIQQAIEACK
ncbi:hypothetical protein CkaCkLH20_13248 [Colletotrichum karsti]|uniref:CFEM domain-containing protein n=1 Tax=Colletotrichum karsti TaxID=1095194 RepID=A0A9P6HTD0_9PEZI|nr:uncharacterized protein CkaCkLH20_13248 [Colletotrichum karsti]KAF9869287.1 hypothetical protein CkaCkLH20_13248 [Colletotrichum karsti]